MKCDGPNPNNEPCRGCRQAGAKCQFEPNGARPKSISVLPSRAPQLFAKFPVATGGQPAQGNPPMTGFYPAGAQPAPPTLSRPFVGEPYSARPSRESLHRPSLSTSVLPTPYRSGFGRPITSPVQPVPQTTVGAPPTAPHAPPPFPPLSSSRPTSSPTIESRMRAVEGALSTLTSVPGTLATLQQSVGGLEAAIESLGNHLAPDVRSRNLEISPATGEDYRSRAWPLTPWLIGLRDIPGLPRFVIEYLGTKASTDASEASRIAIQDAERVVRAEVARLAVAQAPWTRDDVHSLSVYA